MRQFDLQAWFRGKPLAERLVAQEVRPDLIKAAEATAAYERLDLPVAVLQRHLPDDELVHMLAMCRYLRQTGVLALTDRRVLFAPMRAERLAVSVQVGTITATAGKERLDLTTPDGTYIFDQFIGQVAARVVDQLAALQSGGE